MARYIGSVCRLCRRESLKMFLKGERCYSEKCAIEKRSYAPGQHGQAKGKMSEFGIQLREKQKVKRMYGILEKQFRNYFEKAEKMKGITGSNLLFLLESRLDNVAYQLGFATSRTEARLLVRQGHFTVNGKKVNIPSYQVKKNDVVALLESSRSIARFTNALDAASKRITPKWLELSRDEFKGVVVGRPEREDITSPIQEQLIVELYSK